MQLEQNQIFQTLYSLVKEQRSAALLPRFLISSNLNLDFFSFGASLIYTEIFVNGGPGKS